MEFLPTLLVPTLVEAGILYVAIVGIHMVTAGLQAQQANQFLDASSQVILLARNTTSHWMFAS